MFASLILTGIFVVGAGVLLSLALVAALSRHRKAGTGELRLVGATGVVEAALCPEGSVIIQGELWCAHTRTGEGLAPGARVRVVGATGHLLEVEPG